MDYNDTKGWIEDRGADFDTFIAIQDWKNAQAVVEAMSEAGLEHNAMLMRKELLRAQFAFSEKKSPAMEVMDAQMSVIEAALNKNHD